MTTDHPPPSRSTDARVDRGASRRRPAPRGAASRRSDCRCGRLAAAIGRRARCRGRGAPLQAVASARRRRRAIQPTTPIPIAISAYVSGSGIACVIACAANPCIAAAWAAVKPRSRAAVSAGGVPVIAQRIASASRDPEPFRKNPRASRVDHRFVSYSGLRCRCRYWFEEPGRREETSWTRLRSGERRHPPAVTARSGTARAATCSSSAAASPD